MHIQNPRAGSIDSSVRKQQRSQETLIYGENAVAAVFRARCDDVVKAYFSEEKAPLFGEEMRILAAARKAYHIVPAAQIATITGSAHAGGAAVVARKKPSVTIVRYLQSAKELQRDCVLALEEVGNPHNVGAVLRTAAHFGVRALVCAGGATLDGGAAARVAEGGAEAVQTIETGDLLRALGQFHHEGYAVVTTSSHQGSNLYHARFPPRMIVVVGSETEGLSVPILQASDMVLRIPGTGAVESLNVGVAAALVLGEWWRRR